MRRKKLVLPEMLVRKEEFETREISLDEVFLDPNNPRYSPDRAPTPDNEIESESAQKGAFDDIRTYGIEDLMESIKRMGFLPMDKVVVRSLPSGRYVVVEGNRRTAALKRLKEVHRRIPLRKEILESISRFEVLVYKGKRRDIAWLLQGVRHISGIKRWKALREAELIHRLVKEAKMKLDDAASAVAVGHPRALRLFRSFYGYSQFANDEDFGRKIVPNNFVFLIDGIFSRAVGTTPFQEWLEWDDRGKKFKNIVNLKEFLSWICPGETEEGEEIPSVIDSKKDFDLLEVVKDKYSDLFEEFKKKPDFTFLQRQYYEREYRPREVEEWLKALTGMGTKLRDLPDVLIETSNKKNEFVESLKKIKEFTNYHLKALEIE